MNKAVDIEKFPHYEIGRRLRAIRDTKSMSAKDFAAFLNINYTRYINWESGHRRLLPDDAIQFCDVFGVNLDFIYRGKLEQLPHALMMELSSKLQSNPTRISNDTPD